MWEWLGPGGLPGLQNLWRVALRAAVGSTPIHSRLNKCVGVTRPAVQDELTVERVASG